MMDRLQPLPLSVLRLLPGCLLVSGVATAEPAPAGTSAAVASDPAASYFVETCTSCHTIGAGASRGPDLATVEPWPAPQLTSAIRSMERKVGPIAPARVDELLELLKDSGARNRVAHAKRALAPTTDQPKEPANSLLGGALFFGTVALAGGGLPCNSCHLFHGEGGELGPDLTRFAAGAELETLAGTIARAQFSVMRAAYASHPIEPKESRHLAAFLVEARAERRQTALGRTLWWGLGAGAGTFMLALVLIARRPKSVRSELVQRAAKR